MKLPCHLFLALIAYTPMHIATCQQPTKTSSSLPASLPSPSNTAASVPTSAAATQALLFEPPKGWTTSETPPDSPYVKLFIVGKGQKGYPPSINLCIEPYRGTLQEYMKLVQKINQKEGGIWKDLGPLQTQAGKGDLSQLDIETEWGPLRMLHFILVHEGQVYIFTAAARRDEFALYYKEFFASIRSLRFGPVPQEKGSGKEESRKEIN